jgi:hypothetical protein
MKSRRLVSRPRGIWLASLIIISLLATACGREQAATPTATRPVAATPSRGATGVGSTCFEGLEATPTTATPVIAQAEAEARARAAREREAGETRELLHASLVTVNASPNASSFQGKQAWLLKFAFQPPGAQASAIPPAMQHLQYQAHVLVDAQGGLATTSCAGLLPRPTTP